MEASRGRQIPVSKISGAATGVCRFKTDFGESARESREENFD